MSDTKNDLTIHLKLDKSSASASNQQFKKESKGVEQEILADTAAAERAKAELIRATNREKINLAIEAMKASKTGSAAELEALKAQAKAIRDNAEAAKKAAEAQEEMHQKGGSSLKGLTKAAGSFALQMLGLDSVKAVVGTIVENFEQARESAFKASKMVNEYRESLLELAALKGKLGDTTGALKDEVAFRAKTLQTADQARNFQSLALGVGQSAITSGQISEDEFKKLMEYSGSFQATEGGDPRAHATLAGLTPSLIGHPTNAKEVFERTQQYYKIFQPGGPEFSELAKQFNSLAPMAAAGTYKDTQLAALLSAFSTTKTEGGAAATAVQQFTRATLGGVDNSGKPRILDAESRGDYFKKLGVDDEFLKSTKATDLPFKIADLIVADLDKQAKAGGENFSPDIYLKHEGFGNLEDLEAIKLYGKLKSSGQLERSFMSLAGDDARPSFDASMGEINDRRNRDPVFLALRAKYAEELANINVGAGQNEYVDSVMRLAFARRKAGAGFGGEADRETMESYDSVKSLRTFSPSELIYGHRRNTEHEAQKLLLEEAKRVGVTKKEIDAATFGEGGQYRSSGDTLYNLGQRIAEHGGNRLPGFEATQGAAERSLEEASRFAGLGSERAVKLLEDIKEGVNRERPAAPTTPAATPPAPMPGAPAVPFR